MRRKFLILILFFGLCLQIDASNLNREIRIATRRHLVTTQSKMTPKSYVQINEEKKIKQSVKPTSPLWKQNKYIKKKYYKRRWK